MTFPCGVWLMDARHDPWQHTCQLATRAISVNVWLAGRVSLMAENEMEWSGLTTPEVKSWL
jgi:hypothetical protein